MRRRRWISLALVAAGLLAMVSGMGGGDGSREAAAVQVVVTRTPLAAGTLVQADDLATVAVPQSIAVRGAVVDPGAAVGRRSAVAVPAGVPLMTAELAEDRAGPDARDVAIRLDTAAGIPAGAAGGVRADLYATTAGRTTPVLRNVLVVAASAADGEAVATLRVPDRVVPTLVAAEGRAVLRLVVRSPEAP
jgi:pilus assembly protein CpaB